MSKIPLEENVAFFHSHHESAMLTVALEDFSIVIVDIETRNLVRKFVGHTAQLTDAALSPDSRWLITSAMDCTIRVWDIPSSQLIDCFQVTGKMYVGFQILSFAYHCRVVIFPVGGCSLYIFEFLPHW